MERKQLSDIETRLFIIESAVANMAEMLQIQRPLEAAMRQAIDMARATSDLSEDSLALMHSIASSSTRDTPGSPS